MNSLQLRHNENQRLHTHTPVSYTHLDVYKRQTIPYDDMVYDKLIWNKPINSNDLVEEYKNLSKYYIDNNNIIYLIKTKLYRPKIRLLFDDAG